MRHFRRSGLIPSQEYQDNQQFARPLQARSQAAPLKALAQAVNALFILESSNLKHVIKHIAHGLQAVQHHGVVFWGCAACPAFAPAAGAVAGAFACGRCPAACAAGVPTGCMAAAAGVRA